MHGVEGHVSMPVTKRKSSSFDDLVDVDEESGRDHQPNGLGGGCVQQQFEPARLNHGKIGNAGAF
jgi:hypothetical protein